MKLNDEGRERNYYQNSELDRMKEHISVQGQVVGKAEHSITHENYSE